MGQHTAQSVEYKLPFREETERNVALTVLASWLRSLSVRGSEGEAVGGGEASRILMVKTEEGE